MTIYTVLVSTDAGQTWATVPNVEGASPEAAILKVRKASPALKADPDAQFHALTRPAKKMHRQVIERWELGPVEAAIVDDAVIAVDDKPGP